MSDKLNTVKEIWVYSPIKVKLKGEYTTSWKYKNIVHMNVQQDLNELDRNSTGNIDYDIIKCRTTKSYDIKKGDGLYINEEKEKLDKDKQIIPQYIVDKMPKVGRTVTYTCKKNMEKSNV